MRLINKYTISYVLTSFLVLSIGFTIIYVAVKRSPIQSTIGKLRNLNTYVTSELQKGQSIEDLKTFNYVSIYKLGTDSLKIDEIISEQHQWNDQLRDSINLIKVTSFPYINHQLYKIESRASLIEADNEYLTGIFMVFAWTFIFLLSLVVLISQLISSRILAPFYRTLSAITSFNIEDKERFKLEKTTTYEFNRLNAFLEKMVKKSKSDYLSLKELTENTSHELQTPIAVIKAKIELLMQTDLNEYQLSELSVMYNELNRVSRLHHALNLLTKLEHFEITETPLNLSEVIENSLYSIHDLIEMREIRLYTAIEPHVYINFDKNLAEILFSNLINNALKHNQADGSIEVSLNSEKLVIKNTGKKPPFAPHLLFKRFKKDNQNTSSIGIGLAIVKKIADLYSYKVNYEYIEGKHILTLQF
ncbi:HAMP domain-containing sensor histidine kinase [Myroides ceti]|uniref:histidine kinase n=1 Tax=Paenimyroides ceti TaxID=395087 RepID=A0ABT8CQL5_9FLAO|nr:HAMP domain-containing sensor histidine kinase [Paenimyroides ceti]MDN3706469.1 HAMP domain-containing sensor histidine kinase [Paenimyroides ceti]